MTMAGDGQRRESREGRGLEGSTEQVVGFVRNLIDRGRLRPGDRLPAERDLALQIGVSRPSVRAGLHALAAMGVVQSRHGSGTYIPDGPPSLGSEPLSFLAALHGFTRDEMYEARRILEVEAAGLAAERATSEHLATLSEEVAGLFANRDNPHLFLVHDINFHRSVAEAAKNPIVGALRRHGVGALLRAAAGNGGARLRPRSARRRRGAPADLPVDPRARSRGRPPRDERSPRPGQPLPGAGAGQSGSRRAGAAPGPQTQGATDTFRMTRSLFDLTGKTAVVVGGTSGIGRVLALGLADAGADVVATARRQNLVDEVAAEIERRGRRTLRIASRRRATRPPWRACATP